MSTKVGGGAEMSTGSKKSSKSAISARRTTPTANEKAAAAVTSELRPSVGVGGSVASALADGRFGRRSCGEAYERHAPFFFAASSDERISSGVPSFTVRSSSPFNAALLSWSRLAVISSTSSSADAALVGVAPLEKEAEQHRIVLLVGRQRAGACSSCEPPNESAPPGSESSCIRM